MSDRGDPPNNQIVIPANAGTHFDVGFAVDLGTDRKIKMDPSVRWDDDQKKIANPP